MRLRTFTADSMPEALALVKAELGEDAIILSTEEKKDGVYITAAVDPDAMETSSPAPKKPSTTNHQPSTRLPLQGDAIRYDIQHCLRFHNVPELFISKMSATLNDASIASILGQGRMNIANESKHFLKLALEQLCGKFFQFDTQMPKRLMVVGAPGIGKTLAIAKLATRYALAKEKLLVITTDMQRAGGADQLQSFTDILGISLSVCADKKSLLATLKHAGKDAHVLIDTAGCNPYEEEDLAELASLAHASNAEIALVMPAGMDAQEAIDVTEAFMALPISQLIITRTDCTRRFGGLLAAAAAYKLPFSLASGSASVADPIAALTAKTLVQHLLKPL
jgi:flagellar biosynthesis protein FlhF